MITLIHTHTRIRSQFHTFTFFLVHSYLISVNIRTAVPFVYSFTYTLSNRKTHTYDIIRRVSSDSEYYIIKKVISKKNGSDEQELLPIQHTHKRTCTFILILKQQRTKTELSVSISFFESIHIKRMRR